MIRLCLTFRLAKVYKKEYEYPFQFGGVSVWIPYERKERTGGHITSTP
jgi:hypothetical protein